MAVGRNTSSKSIVAEGVVPSLASLAAVPFDPLYSISNAAAFSLSQSFQVIGRRIHCRAALEEHLPTLPAHRGLRSDR